MILQSNQHILLALPLRLSRKAPPASKPNHTLMQQPAHYDSFHLHKHSSPKLRTPQNSNSSLRNAGLNLSWSSTPLLQNLEPQPHANQTIACTLQLTQHTPPAKKVASRGMAYLARQRAPIRDGSAAAGSRSPPGGAEVAAEWRPREGEAQEALGAGKACRGRRGRRAGAGGYRHSRRVMGG